MSEHAAPDGSVSRPDDEAVFVAPALLRILWADPDHTPEHLALWSIKNLAPRASAEAERLRRSGGTENELQRRVVERHTRIAMAEGAVVGGPLVVFVPVAFCAALLAEAQMTLELAALAGHPPDDQMPAADLLVLQGVYPSEAQTRGALASVTRDPGRHEGGRLPRGSRLTLIKRMAYLLGVLEANPQKVSRARSALQYAFLGLMFAVGFVLPLIWLPYMAVTVRRTALTLGERAIQFYAQHRGVDAGIAVRKAPRVRVPVAGGLLRTIALVALPVAVAVIALLTGLDIGNGRLVTAGVLLIAVSALSTMGWFVYRWLRRRRTAPIADSR